MINDPNALQRQMRAEQERLQHVFHEVRRPTELRLRCLEMALQMGVKDADLAIKEANKLFAFVEAANGQKDDDDVR